MGYQPKPGDTGSLPKVKTGLYETQLTVVQTAEADTQIENSGKVYLPAIPNGIDIVDYIPYGGVYERPAYEGRLAEDVEPPPDPPPGDPCNLRDVELSYLYPIMNLDSIDVTHQLTGAQILTWIPGDVDVTHAVTGGILLDVLRRYDMEVEDIEVTHAQTGGVLLDVLRRYEMDVEDIDVSHSQTGGELLVILITYSNWPIESVDVLHSVTGGTLI